MNQTFQYYSLRHKCKGSIEFPQLHMVKGYDFKSLNSVHNIKFSEFPNFQPDLRFEINPNEENTNILSQAAISSYGFIVSRLLLESLNNLKLPANKVWEIEVSKRKELMEYSWFQILDLESLSLVNWTESKFIVKKFSKILGDIQISGYQDYVNKSKDLGSIKSIRPKIIFLISKPKCDIFTLNGLTTRMYMNEEVIEKIKGCGISDLEFIKEQVVE